MVFTEKCRETRSFLLCGASFPGCQLDPRPRHPLQNRRERAPLQRWIAGHVFALEFRLSAIVGQECPTYLANRPRKGREGVGNRK